MSAIKLNAYKGSASLTQNTNNLSPISLPSLESFGGGQFQNSVGNERSNIGGFVGNNSNGVINILDNGAIDKSFDFAAFTLSETLAAFINAGREQNTAQTVSLANIGEAIKNVTTTTVEATTETADKIETMKKYALYGAIAFGAYWFLFKGK